MKNQRLIFTAILSIVFAIVTPAQETTIKLPTTDNTSSFNITKSDDTKILEVKGDGTIVGDGSNLTGVVTSESDPQVGSNTSNYIPKWNGTALTSGTIYDNGKIGIGITNPGADLTIKQSSNSNSGIGGLRLVNAGSDNDWWTINLDSADQLVFILNGSWKNYMTTSGSWYTTSDVNLKKDIDDLSYGLQSLMRLRSVTFRFKDQQSSEPKLFGFIAQEVEEVIPEMVNEKDGIKTLCYDKLTPVLTKCIQEQQMQIDELKKRLEKLEKLLSN